MTTRASEPLGDLREDGTIVFERLLPGRSRAWAYIIDGDKRASWLAGGDMPTIPGVEARMRFHNANLASDAPPPACWPAGDTHLGLLVDALNGTTRRPFWASLLAAEARYADLPGMDKD